jgi:hypothetical protein
MSPCNHHLYHQGPESPDNFAIGCKSRLTNGEVGISSICVPHTSARQGFLYLSILVAYKNVTRLQCTATDHMIHYYTLWEREREREKASCFKKFVNKNQNWPGTSTVHITWQLQFGVVPGHCNGREGTWLAPLASHMEDGKGVICFGNWAISHLFKT